MLRFKEARSGDDIEGLEDDWKKLQKRADRPNVFQSYEWISIWWKHFSSGKDPRVVFAWDEDNPIFVAPLFVEKTRKTGIPLGRISIMGDELSPHHGFLTAGDIEYALGECLSGLLRGEKTWDYMELRRLPENGCVIQAMKRAGEARGLHFIDMPLRRYPFITINGNYDDYLKEKVSKRLRKTVRNRINRLKKAGEVRFLHTNEMDPEEAFDQILSLSERGWKHRAGLDPLTSGSNREFFKDVLIRLREEGMLSLTAMELDGRRIAFDLSFIMQNIFYAYYTVFDEQFTHLSLGKVIVSHMVEKAFSDGLSEMDFSEGEQEYKLEWTKACRQYREAYILNKKSLWYPFLLSKLIVRRKLKTSPNLLRYIGQFRKHGRKK